MQRNRIIKKKSQDQILLVDYSNEIIKNVSKKNIDFTHYNLSRCYFFNCDLSGCDFSHSNLTEIIFVDCNLSHTKFNNAVLIKAKFNRCNLTGSDFSTHQHHPNHLNTGTDLSEAYFMSVILHDVKLINTKIHNTQFRHIQVNEKTDFGNLRALMSQDQSDQIKESYQNFYFYMNEVKKNRESLFEFFKIISASQMFPKDVLQLIIQDFLRVEDLEQLKLQHLKLLSENQLALNKTLEIYTFKKIYDDGYFNKDNPILNQMIAIQKTSWLCSYEQWSQIHFCACKALSQDDKALAKMKTSTFFWTNLFQPAVLDSTTRAILEAIRDDKIAYFSNYYKSNIVAQIVANANKYHF